MSLWAGAMSGTSLDGIDVALVELEGEAERPDSFALRAFRTEPYDGRMRARLRAAIDAGSAGLLCDLDFELGRRIGRAISETLAGAGIPPASVRAVGSHGQTVWHTPPAADRPGATLQLGRAAVIAELTGIPVVSDFRARDMAAGGHGAPLTAYTDDLLFAGPRARAIQNIGGMGNLTIVPARGGDDVPLAFDTGPGVALLDAAVERRSGGEATFDRDGRLAASGRVSEAALAPWLEDPFFDRAPPRSTGREHFSESRLARWLEEHADLSTPDVAATLTELTARTIADAFRWTEVSLEGCYLCGGGARNLTLARRVAELLDPLPVRDLGALGLDPDAREAVAFALLARQHALGFTGNAPWATGAVAPRVLGSWTPA